MIWRWKLRKWKKSDASTRVSAVFSIPQGTHPVTFLFLTFFGAKKEAKKHSPNQGLPPGEGCNTKSCRNRQLFSVLVSRDTRCHFYRLTHRYTFIYIIGKAPRGSRETIHRVSRDTKKGRRPTVCQGDVRRDSAKRASTMALAAPSILRSSGCIPLCRGPWG